MPVMSALFMPRFSLPFQKTPSSVTPYRLKPPRDDAPRGLCGEALADGRASALAHLARERGLFVEPAHPARSLFHVGLGPELPRVVRAVVAPERDEPVA